MRYGIICAVETNKAFRGVNQQEGKAMNLTKKLLKELRKTERAASKALKIARAELKPLNPTMPQFALAYEKADKAFSAWNNATEDYNAAHDAYYC